MLPPEKSRRQGLVCNEADPAIDARDSHAALAHKAAVQRINTAHRNGDMLRIFPRTGLLTQSSVALPGGWTINVNGVKRGLPFGASALKERMALELELTLRVSARPRKGAKGVKT